jgi:radical SAM superfamily enzyme YgiQ (UPF0313 family)
MQIELIAPASEDSALLPRLGLGLLAAQTPPDIEIIYTDDIVTPFDLDRDVKDVDLVGISVDSKTARRAYDIAARYRQRGVKVVLGGIHPTALPDEARLHADSVVVGEADKLWGKVLADFKAGELQPRYDGGWPEMSGIPWARRDLFRSRKYIPFQVVQTMRGCPYPCEFCSVSTANGTTLRMRPVDDVIGEFKTLGSRLLFADDNVMIHRKYAEELFTRLADLGKSWVGQCSLAAIQHEPNIALMARSGCKGLFVGLESIDEATLAMTGKKQNRPERYEEIIGRLRAYGIGTWASFVFGFDTDDPDIFDRTVEFAIKARLTMASFAILTPYPGTRLYRRLAEEGRLTDKTWWLHADHDAGSPYFIPKRMTREELRDGWMRAWKNFYSWPSIFSRWTLPPRASLGQSAAYLPLNVMQRRLAVRKVVGGHQRFLTANEAWQNPNGQALPSDDVSEDVARMDGERRE